MRFKFTLTENIVQHRTIEAELPLCTLYLENVDSYMAARMDPFFVKVWEVNKTTGAKEYTEKLVGYDFLIVSNSKIFEKRIPIDALQDLISNKLHEGSIESELAKILVMGTVAFHESDQEYFNEIAQGVFAKLGKKANIQIIQKKETEQ